ncbi:MAG: YfhO family protein [Phycisphaerae bacterium]|nr:YfhO family protein [Phycisphaerae bacterium]
MTLSGRQRRLLCAALFIGLPPVMLAGAWRLGGASALEDDLIYYLPVRAFIGEAIADGEWPLWNPHVGMGTSLAADPQGGLWYPPTWLFAILPMLWAYPVTICMHFSLAAWGMYRFLRAIGREWRAALLAAVAFEFCGFLVGHRAHLTILQAAAWLPWMLYAWHQFAVSPRRGYLVLASAALGLQMLIQHIQITVLCVVIVTAYVAVMLWPRRRSLLWWYPAGVIAGGMIGAVQTLPMLAAFARSTRSAPAYYLFVENSYTPTSLFMWLFPFIFGTRTPNFYDQPWWGWSHLCEQATYASIAVLVLAAASLALWRRDRQVRFWWLAGGACMLLALGRFTPLARLLFHVPLFGSLRVPARWVIGFDVAMVVLAASTFDALLRGGDTAAAVRRWTHRFVLRGLPIAAGLCFVAMAVVRAMPDAVAGGRVADAIRSGIDPRNPAIWVPALLMVATAWALLQVCRDAGPRHVLMLFAVVLVDLASFAAFVDVDTRQYLDVEALFSSPLAQAIDEAEGPRLKPEADAFSAERLWVPRVQADYARPVDVLWPHTNLLHGVSVFNSYGPLWSAESRLLFRFMPWGSSEDAVGLLRNPALLQAFGVRWLAVRTDAERELMGFAGPQADPPLDAMFKPGEVITIRDFSGFELPVSVPAPGLYAAEFRSLPIGRNANRWFLWIGDGNGNEASDCRMFDPADHGVIERTVRYYLRVPEPVPAAVLRGWVDPGGAVSITDVRFGRVAGLASIAVPEPYRHVADLPNGVTLFELDTPRPRLAWADHVTVIPDVAPTVERLRLDPQGVGLPGGVIVDRAVPAAASEPAAGDVEIVHETLQRLAADVRRTQAEVLVFNESHDPGWRAWIDGEPAEILRANAVVQAVAVPAGAHRVEFRYWPQALTAGLALSLAALVGLALALVLNLRGRSA